MKKIIFVLLVSIILFSGCKKKEQGTIIVHIEDDSQNDENMDSTTGATEKKMEPKKKVAFPPADSSYKVVGELKGISNFVVKYDSLLYRGGEIHTEEGFERLKSLGIKTIVTITPTDDERETAGKFGMKLIELPFESTDGPSSENIGDFLEVIDTAEKPVYVHCHGGTHRAGVLGMSYRLYKNNWSQERAIIEYGRLGGDLRIDDPMIKRVLNYK